MVVELLKGLGWFGSRAKSRGVLSGACSYIAVGLAAGRVATKRISSRTDEVLYRRRRIPPLILAKFSTTLSLTIVSRKRK